MVNGSSASASEIVSGSLQDLDRAVIMGARSFGKGLVQRPLKLTYGTQLKVTISRYYTPSGRCIQSLDYWNRDSSGNAVRNTQFNDFTTKNGRKVQDGGGILPEIEIKTQKTNELTKALIINNVIFDYATEYYYNHTVDQLQDFDFTEADFSGFKDFVSSHNFSFETKAETAIKKAMDKEDEIFSPDVYENYTALLKEIENSKISALERYKNEIKKNITDEIVKRYFYREGLYDYYLTHDDAIAEASTLLTDKAAYQAILK